MDAQPSTTLPFFDAPKLELDVLIDQLVERARDVQNSQGRLRTLLRAIETIIEDPSLEAVLRNVVHAACTLTGAQYGAFGVVDADQGPDHGLEQFVHTGMDEKDVALIGRLPTGRGLLGALIDDARPIRLQHIDSDERSVGFPAGHPPMDSFLGVPVRVRGEVFGNLYLANSTSDQFSAEDEELAGALALAAGTAIFNARLLQESQQQQRWLAASIEISAQVLAAVDEDDPLTLIARAAFDAADADLVAVSLVRLGSSELVIEAAVGDGAAELVGRRVDIATSRVRDTVQGGGPRLSPESEGRVPAGTQLDLGTLMALPLDNSQDGVRGVVAVVRYRGRRRFDEHDLTMAAGFAGHAGIALELADARMAAQRVVRSEDRERIARNLHDHVIQELFAIGLGLETTATFVEPGGIVADRIAQRVRDIDRTIRQIRTSIFELRGPIDDSEGGARSHVLQIAADLTDALGFVPQVVFAGLVDFRLDAALAEDLFACVREVLTNVAKHAQATRVDVDLSVTSSQLTLVVVDDGIGYRSGGRFSGLANLQVRAEQRGGSFDVTAADGRGTTVTWKVPL